MNKLFEFTNNDSLDTSVINEIKMLIFYDGGWMFPIIGFDIMEKSLEVEITTNIKELVKNIVIEMNYRKVDPNNWEENFYTILQELNF